MSASRKGPDTLRLLNEFMFFPALPIRDYTNVLWTPAVRFCDFLFLRFPSQREGLCKLL
jgi:hypothetical protein